MSLLDVQAFVLCVIFCGILKSFAMSVTRVSPLARFLLDHVGLSLAQLLWVWVHPAIFSCNLAPTDFIAQRMDVIDFSPTGLI